MTGTKSLSDEEIETLTSLVRMAEATTISDKYLKNKISRDAAISEVYLRNTEKK